MEKDTISNSLILFVLVTSVVATFVFVPVLADPFGVFNYDNPSIVAIQGLRAHLFEAHDAVHMTNSSEIVMHLEMANKEISQIMQNLTAGQLPDNPNSNLSTILQTVQVQLNDTSSIAIEGNMEQVRTNLQQTDDQLASAAISLGYKGSNNSTAA